MACLFGLQIIDISHALWNRVNKTGSATKSCESTLFAWKDVGHW